MPKSSKKGVKQLLYVEVRTLDDIARFSCRFDSSARELISSKNGKKQRVIGLAEGMDEKVIALYTDIDLDADTIRYVYGEGQEKGTEFVHGTELRQPGVCYINLVGLEMSKFGVAKESAFKGVNCVRIGRLDDLVKSLVKRGVMRDNIEYAYAFGHKGKTVIGAFDIIEELASERKTFYYSTSNSSIEASFARYKYSTGSIDFSNDFGEHSYMYVKIINLAKAFPFFKE